eukprot:3514755-Rhodomonas_salina.1
MQRKAKERVHKKKKGGKREREIEKKRKGGGRQAGDNVGIGIRISVRFGAAGGLVCLDTCLLLPSRDPRDPTGVTGMAVAGNRTQQDRA